MLGNIRRELKDNLGDQLRGIRQLVRSLSSDAPDTTHGNSPLPPLPPELQRLVGSTFHTVDGVMTTLQTIAMPFRQRQDIGFGHFNRYFGTGEAAHNRDEALADSLYGTLKAVASAVTMNELILKARIADVSKRMIAAQGSQKWTSDDLSECCATLYTLLTKTRPMVTVGGGENKQAWKLYAAVSLVFGLTLSEKLANSEILSFAQQDALVICDLRAKVFMDAATSNAASDALVNTFASLLRHLP